MRIRPSPKNLKRVFTSDFEIALGKAESMGNNAAIAYLLKKYTEGDTIESYSHLLEMESSQAVSSVFQHVLNMSCSDAEEFRKEILFKFAVKKAEREGLKATLAYIYDKFPPNDPISINDEVWQMHPEEFVFTILKELKLFPENLTVNIPENVSKAQQDNEKNLLEELSEIQPKAKSKRGKKKNKQKSDIETESNEQDGNQDVAMSKNNIGIENDKQDGNQDIQMPNNSLSVKEEEENEIIKKLRAEIAEKEAELMESQKQKEDLEEELRLKGFEIEKRDSKLREGRLKRESLEEQLKEKDNEILDLKRNFNHQEEKNAEILELRMSHLKHVDRVMKIGSLRYFSVLEGMDMNDGEKFIDLESKAKRQCYTCAQSAKKLT